MSWLFNPLARDVGSYSVSWVIASSPRVGPHMGSGSQSTAGYQFVDEDSEEVQRGMSFLPESQEG